MPGLLLGFIIMELRIQSWLGSQLSTNIRIRDSNGNYANEIATFFLTASSFYVFATFFFFLCNLSRYLCLKGSISNDDINII